MLDRSRDKTSKKERDNTTTLMETFTLEIGKMISLTEMVSTFSVLVRDMKVN